MQAISTTPHGQQNAIPLDLAPGLHHQALWGPSDTIVFGSTTDYTTIWHIDLRARTTEKIGHGRLELYTPPDVYPQIYGGKIVVSDETGCLTLLDVNDRTETIIYEDQFCTDFEILQINPDWIVYSQETTDGQRFARFNLNTALTEELYSSPEVYRVAYTAPDGALIVFEDTLRIHVFTLSNGVETVPYIFDGPAVLSYETTWFNVFNPDFSVTFKTYELVYDAQQWHVQTVDRDQIGGSAQWPRGWFIDTTTRKGWFLRNDSKGYMHRLNIGIIVGTQLSILEFDPDVPAKAQRNLVMVTAGMIVLLTLIQIMVNRKLSAKPD